MLSDKRLQNIIGPGKEALAEAIGTAEQSESWAICDGALVIYDLDNPPKWFAFDRDDDGNSVVDGEEHRT